MSAIDLALVVTYAMGAGLVVRHTDCDTDTRAMVYAAAWPALFLANVVYRLARPRRDEGDGT